MTGLAISLAQPSPTSHFFVDDPHSDGLICRRWFRTGPASDAAAGTSSIKFCKNVSDPTLAATLKKTPSTPPYSSVPPSGWSACWSRSTPVLTGWATCVKRFAPSRATCGNVRRRIRKKIWVKILPRSDLADWPAGRAGYHAVDYLRCRIRTADDHLRAVSRLYRMAETRMAPDWPGDFHLRELSTVFFWIFWRLPRHRPRRKALFRGTLIAAIGFEIIKNRDDSDAAGAGEISIRRRLWFRTRANGLLLLLRPSDPLLRRMDCDRGVQRR